MGATRSIGKQETASQSSSPSIYSIPRTARSVHMNEAYVAITQANYSQWKQVSSHSLIARVKIEHEARHVTFPPLEVWSDIHPLAERNARQRKLQGMDLAGTYAWARPASPCGCGWTRAGRSRQNPRQILQSLLQTPPHERTSRGARAHACSGCQCLSGHWVYDQGHGGQSSVSCWRLLALACPVPQCLSSPQATRPPILLSPSGRTAHPGFPTPERRHSPWTAQFWSDVRSNRFPRPSSMLLWSRERTSDDQSALEIRIQNQPSKTRKWKKNVRQDKCLGKKNLQFNVWVVYPVNKQNARLGVHT